MYNPNAPNITLPKHQEPENPPTQLPEEWELLTYPERLQYLTKLSLKRKLEILSCPCPTDDSDSSIRARRLLNDAADSILQLTVKINEIQFHIQNTNMLHQLAQEIKDTAKLKHSQK